MINWLKLIYRKFKYRKLDDIECMCGEEVGCGYGACEHGGCLSVKEYLIYGIHQTEDKDGI